MHPEGYAPTFNGAIDLCCKEAPAVPPGPSGLVELVSHGYRVLASSRIICLPLMGGGRHIDRPLAVCFEKRANWKETGTAGFVLTTPLLVSR